MGGNQGASTAAPQHPVPVIAGGLGIAVVLPGLLVTGHLRTAWDLTLPGGTASWVVTVACLAAALFLAAGVLRLVTWRVTGDPRSELVGAAHVLMACMCLPLGALGRVIPPDHEAFMLGVALYAVVSVTAMWLVARALRPTEEPTPEQSRRFGDQLITLGTGALLLVAVVEDLAVLAAGAGLDRSTLARAVAATVVMGWVLLSARAALDVNHWARQSAPLLWGMGLAQMVSMVDSGRTTGWTLAGVLVCAAVAAAATVLAVTAFGEALTTEAEETTELARWREQLAHDARSACLGLRAAMEILERYDGRVDPAVTASLRVAALQEVGHIEHLLTRSSTEPCETFDVTEVVRAVSAAARPLGTLVTVHGDPATGHGRAQDLVAVLKTLLVNAQTHAPGSAVTMRVRATSSGVVIACSDDGPGLGTADPARLFERGYHSSGSPGSGLGLHHARELMRDQGGDLVLAATGFGAGFEVRLPSAPAPQGTRATAHVPAQRTRSTVAAAAALTPLTPVGTR